MSLRQVLERGRKFIYLYDRDKWYWSLASRAVFASTGVFAKTVLNNMFKPKVYNLDKLLEAYEMSRIENRPLMTVMNHTSVIDEPLCWGTLPFEHLLHPSKMRWTLGAENICFKNRPLGLFFSLGQVLSTSRFGAGPFQGAVDAAVYLMSSEDSSSGAKPAEWLHVYPESYVHQVHTPYENTLGYFRWGSSRLVLEPTKAPIVVPIFTHGFEKTMPEDRSGWMPSSWGHEVCFNFGDVMDSKSIEGFRNRWANLVATDLVAIKTGDLTENLRTGELARSLRTEVALFLRDGVLDARKMFNFAPDESRFSDPGFWSMSEQLRGVSLRKAKNQH